MEKSNVKKLSFGASLTSKLSSLIMLALHLYCMLAFYNGAIDLGISDDVNFYLNLLDVESLELADIAYLYLPLLKFAFLIVALVNFINAFVRFFMLFGGGENKLANTQKQTFLIAKKFMGSSTCMLTFIMISNWFEMSSITNSGWLIIAAISVGIIISRFVNAVVIKAPATTVITQIVYSVVTLAIIGMVMMYASAPVVDEVSFYLDFIGGSASVEAVLKAAASVLHAVVMLNAVLMVRGCRSYALLPNKRLKKSGINIFVCTLVAVMLLVASEYLGAEKLEINALYSSVIEPKLPLILAATAALFFGLIQPKVSKALPEENTDNDIVMPEQAPMYNANYDPAYADDAVETVAAEEPETVSEPEPQPEVKPEPNIVIIGKKVKKIKSHTYRNRKDINVIVIPESVAYVEGYSFFGCTELQEIHCERKSQTRFWHKKWNFGCPAKVIWNSAEEETEDQN